MNKFKRFLSLVLVLCMVMAFVPVGASAADASYAYNIVHVDAGRKYFSVNSLKTIIDNAAAAGFNQVELYLSDNQGFRFKLDDMKLTTAYGTYDLTPALGDGYSDSTGKAPDGTGKYLTQDEMDGIIAYANEQGIDIVPCINVPGHMGAILEEFPSFRYVKDGTASNSSISLDNAEAVAFALALTEKYASYFASRGCKFYNVGADEYANDLSNMGFEGMGSTLYTKFVQFLNDAADIVIGLGMTPRAFNDGFYYKDYSISVEPDKAYEVCYWSSGWGGYDVAAASTIAQKGHKMINTNGDYYWILGGSQCTAAKASQFEETAFQGSTISDPAGSMFCIWCDTGNADTEANVVSKTAPVIAAFGTAVPAVESLVESDEDDEPVESQPAKGETAPAVTEERTINVAVNATATDTITGGEYAADETALDKSISTVSVTTTPAVEATVSYEAMTVTCNALINHNGNREATGYYHKVGENYYPVYASRATNAYNSNRYDYTWYYSEDNGVSFEQIGEQTYVRTSATANFTVYEKSGTDAVAASTTVTFKGVKVGTTYVTVGNVRYTINVVAEDLSKVEDLEVDFWVTNRPVTPDGMDYESVTSGNTVTRIYTEISAVDFNTAAGKPMTEVAAATGTNGDNAMAFWKATCLPSDQWQTDGSGVDKTRAGTDFTHIRYYAGSWSYSVDGRTWTDVPDGAQIVAYYMQTTAVTDEVTTEVVDWGEAFGNWFNDSSYVLIDYAVKYEDGQRAPNAFPITNVTQKFHCSSDSTNVANGVVAYDNNTGVYYRNIGAIRAVETAEYEVYMITVTPTSDNAKTYLSSGANSESTGQSDFYAGTEKVVWVDNMANLGDFADSSKHYTSISGDITFSVGGEPFFDGVEIYNRHGMLVTYYVRAKVTPDSLTVHYIDRSVESAPLEFYSYNIIVKEGTYFHQSIGLDSNGSVINGNVTNIYNNTQTVSSDLKTLTQIGAQYANTEYECKELIRSADGKHVYLYYEFRPRVYFVSDFGLAMNITGEDLHENLSNSNIESITYTGSAYTSYGKLAANTDGSITYQPVRVMRGVDFVTLLVTTKTAVSGILGDASKVFAFRVYIIPANTVYYEETFASYSGDWAVSNADSALRQETQTKDAAPYGWTGGYTTVGASGGTEATNSTGVDLAGGITKPDSATFAFTGTGVDVYANCDTNTSIVFATIRDADGKLVKMYQVDTVAKNGTSTVTSNQAAESFGLPIVSVTGLAHGAYTVELTHTKSAHFTDGRENNEILRIDGFRVYGTMGDNTSYYSDAEKNVNFVDVRDSVLTSLNVGASAENFEAYYGGLYSQVYEQAGTTKGMVTLTASDAKDLVQNGPKNEIFLQPGDALTFTVTGDAQIGLKAVTGAASWSLNGGEAKALNTSTEMYYQVNGVTTIRNSGSTLLSVTKLKLQGETQISEVTAEQIGYALTLMGLAPADAEVDAPEQEVYYRDAVLTVKVTDYKNRPVADLTLTANGVQGEEHTFTAAEILAAVKAQLPEAYALVNEAKIADTTVVYGGSDAIATRAGKAAVVQVTFVDKRTGAVVAEREIVSVQTSDRSWVQLTASDFRQIAPAGYKVIKAQSLKAAYGSSYSVVVTVG